MSDYTREEKKPNIFSNFFFGFRIFLSEMQWIALSWLRSNESKQLRKRLQEEHTALGAAIADLFQGQPISDNLPGLDDKAVLALKQVRFLQEELHHLQTERQTMREEFINRRKNRIGLS